MTPKSIYTKKGDKGETGLLSGERVEKTSIRVEAYGTLDELNAAIGIAKVHSSEKLAGILETVQQRLYYLSSELASSDASKVAKKASEEDTWWLEVIMDELNEEMPAATHFVIPGGTKAAAFLHLARTVCRRAERGITKLSHEANINPMIMKFINRLSDFLFELARYANIVDGEGDTIIWHGGTGLQKKE
ncbi:MAG: cob(I)yrinic acid a,c-diamide adenosyltransferase [Promethearchaeota archaeon]